MRKWALVAAIGVFVCAALAASIGGCGGAGASRSALRAEIAQAQRTHEFPAPRPPAERVGRGSASAIAAVRRFVSAYINWHAQTVSADMQKLAGQSVGQARSALALAAAQTASDYELKRGGIANRGSVESIAPLPGHHDQYVVVTREQTTATNTPIYDGLRPAWHVAIATVQQIRQGRWALSGWQPES